MLSLLTCVVLASSEAPPGGVQLNAHGGRSARLVVAQASLPLPPPPPPLVAPETSQRMAALQNEIDDLSGQLLKLPSRFWPSYSVALAVIGGVALVVSVVFLVTQAWVGVPVVWIAVAVGGLALLVFGVASGVITVSKADSERQRLQERRDELELELRTLRRQSTAPADTPWLEIARF